MADLVWYAAYGSNLDRARFRCYLQGGRPDRGRGRQRGCRDASAPLADQPIVLPYRIYFDGHSFTWGGATAFVEHRHDPAADTLARAYLVTAGQFADVVDQECGWSVGRPASAIDTTGLAGPGLYGYVLSPGRLDGVPVVTCTCPEPVGFRDGRPSLAYLATMARGLRDSHGLDADEVARYFARIVPTATARGARWTAAVRPPAAACASRR